MAEPEKKEAPEVKGARLVPNPDREKMVPLVYPVEYDGKTITEIRVCRITGKQVQTYMQSMGTSDQFVIPPMIDCPFEVWEALDADDQTAVEEAAMPFFPRRLKEAATLLLQSGGPSSDS